MTPTAAQRAADAMLRSLGATEVALRLPGVSTADATSTELGLAAVPTQDVTLEPAIIAARPIAADSGRQQYELLVSAAALQSAAEQNGFASEAEMLNSALGIVVAGALLRISGFAAELVAATPVLFKIRAGQ
jgi:hypothetical protein